MLGKRSNPVIGKITGSVVSGNKAVFVDVATTSPKSPLEFKIQSPRGLIRGYDQGVVGLSIVAALEKSGETGPEVQGNNKTLYNRNISRSNPIPVTSTSNSNRYGRGGGGGGYEEEMLENDSSLEDYTFVTCRGPDNQSYTKVYCDGGKHGRRVFNATEFDRRSCIKSRRPSLFDISPARLPEVTTYPASDFLSSCHLCQKKLHGKDIYMYRGEKAFCSSECRYRQIVTDERKEKCSSEASRSSEYSTSPYTAGQIFSTGILAV